MIDKFHDSSSLLLTLFWVLAYVLMIRRGFKDKSYGMPVIALCLNLSWEFVNTFFSQIETQYRVFNGLFFVFDVGVLYTCFRFGREDFDWPILKERFHTFLLGSLVACGVGVYLFEMAWDDTYGGIFAAINTPLYSALLVAMLLRRNSVKGQSLYIGLLILLGDAAGYIPTLFAQQQGQVDVAPLWIHTYYAYAVLLNILYVGIYCYIARRDGVGLWNRL